MGVEDYNKQQLERLREHKIAFDQEAMWAAMQKKKKKRGALYFFTMALVALAIVFFTCFLFSKYNGENPNYHIENLNRSENNTGERTSANTAISNSIKTENKPTRVESSTTLYDSGENKISSKSTLDVKNSTESNHSIENQEKNRPSLSSQINRMDTRASTKKKIENIYDSSSENTSNDPSHMTNRQNSLSTIEDDQVSDLINESENQKESKSDESIKTSTDKLINIQSLKVYEYPYLESLSDPKKEFGKLEIQVLTITEVIKTQKSRFLIGAYGGAGYLFRQSNLENTTELGSETLEEVSIGLELKYQLRPNLFFRSGIEYWHATESNEASSSSIINIKALDELPNGFTELDNGILITNSYSKFYTVYQSYNIPIFLGWNTNNDTWNLFAEAGVLYNFKTGQRQSESFVGSEGDIFQIGTQNQISPIAGVGLSFSPSSEVELFARSNWRGRQFITNKESSRSLKFGAVRAQIGVRLGI